MLDGYEKEVKRLKEHISRLSWYMRGGVTYPEMMAMSLKDIANFAKIIEENMELSKKTKQLIL
tara:strand:+ start:1228 stop:1416 length:189 start_codon:yes stop_codon:yes gene_type:complete